MKIKFIFLVVFVNVFVSLQAQDKSLYKKEIFTVNNDTLPYRILLPQHYDASKKYPLILVLHGAGERGTDNESQLVHGSTLFLKDSIREKYPAIVVFPQCRLESYWSNVDRKVNDLGKTTMAGYFSRILSLKNNVDPCTNWLSLSVPLSPNP